MATAKTRNANTDTGLCNLRSMGEATLERKGSSKPARRRLLLGVFRHAARTWSAAIGAAAHNHTTSESQQHRPQQPVTQHDKFSKTLEEQVRWAKLKILIIRCQQRKRQNVDQLRCGRCRCKNRTLLIAKYSCRIFSSLLLPAAFPPFRFFRCQRSCVAPLPFRAPICRR